MIAIRYYVLLLMLVGLTVAFISSCGGSDKKASTEDKTAVKAEKEPAPEPVEEQKSEVASGESSEGSSGEDLFDDKGCASCHFEDEGTVREPYPSKQLLAALSYEEFRKISKEGRPGTLMTPQDLSDEEAKTIYEWIKQFKK